MKETYCLNIYTTKYSNLNKCGHFLVPSVILSGTRRLRTGTFVPDGGGDWREWRIERERERGGRREGGRKGGRE